MASDRSARPKTNTEAVSGRTLGDFAVGELLGAGGFGAVYHAEQISLNRPAVVKVLHASHRSDPEFIERFFREAQLASSLEHPYAAHVYAFGAEDDGLLWIAMERVRGMGLDVLLRTRGALSLSTFVPLFERICEVVFTANEAGIIHRDLKPANVMVMTRAGQVLPKLLDFGIAKAIDVADADTPGESLGRAKTAPIVESGPMQAHGIVESGPTEAHGVVGSPHYMAPEQWRGDPVSAQTDIYALGVLTYESLTGRLPFAGETALELGDAHASEPVPPLGGDLPVELDVVLSRAMAKQPADRFTSALDFAAALRGASGLDGEAPLPQLEPAVRSGLMADAPEPIAESIAVLDTARNPHQARDAVIIAVEALYRYIGLLAVASRSRIGPGEGEKTVAIDSAIVALRRGGLDAPGWRQLTSAITAPFADRPDAFPIPQLVTAAGDPTFKRVAALPGSVVPGAGTAQVREWLSGALDDLAALAEVVDFIRDYPVVVPRPGFCEWWMGTRRSFRGVVPAIELDDFPAQSGAVEHEGHPVLVDLASRPVLAMWPLLMVGEPAPGVAKEMFLLEGRSREGYARLVAVPSGFERHAPEPWEWLRRELMAGREISGTAPPVRKPYPGLAAFTSADAANFVGRERETQEMLNRLRIDPLVTVVGPSGAGKSSFVQAGVLPLVDPSWEVVIARPGSTPLATLASHLEKAELLPERYSASEATALLRSDPGRLGIWLRDVTPVILVIDQLEELFTLCLDDGERVAFAEALARAASDHDEPIRVIATLRDDFLLRAEALPGLRRRLARGLQLLTTPAPDELRRMLVEPAQRAGFAFDDETLPDEMIEEVTGVPGALALLAFTASKLWELRDRHFFQLTRKAYEGMGGVGGALAQHAEQSLEQLPSQDRELVREAFRHLVTAEGTRAVASRADLEQLIGGGDRAEAAIEQLIASRLLVASEDASGESRIEIIHEALIEAWPRLARWRHEDAEGARLRDQIRAASRQWDERDRPRGLLWRGDALLELELWRKRFGDQLTRTELAFADASSGEAARGRRFRAVILALAMIGLAAAAAVLLRFYRTADAERQRAERQLTRLFQEQGRQAVLAGEPMRALAYLDEAYDRGARGGGVEFMIADSLDALDGQLARLEGHSARLLSVAFDLAGERLITASGDKTARIWNLETGQLIELIGHDDLVHDAVFSPDGRLASTGSSDRTARIWDAKTGEQLRELKGHNRGISKLVWIGTDRLLTAGRDGLAVIWDVESGDEIIRLEGHTDWLWTAAVSADQKWIATGSHDKTARIWNAASGEQVAVLQHDEVVGSLSWSSNGQRLLTASWDGKARIWTRHGELMHTLGDHAGPIWSAALSPDGELAVTGSQDETARLWRVDSGKRFAVLEGHRAAIINVAFSPDGQKLATAAQDDTVRLWSRSGQLLAVFAGHTDTPWRVAFSPDSQQLATAGFDHTARIWDATRSRLIAETSIETTTARDIAVSDDGQWVVCPQVRAERGELHVWKLGEPVKVHLRTPVPMQSAAFEPTGTRIAIGFADGRVELVEREGKPPETVEIARLEGVVHSVSFASGELFAAGLRAAVFFERSGKTWIPGRELALFDNTAVAEPSADGQLVAAGSKSGEVGVWKSDGTPVWRASLHSVEISAIALTPDGKLIAASAGKTLSISDLRSGDLGARIEADAELSSIALVDDGVFATSSSNDGVIRIWSVEGGGQIAQVATTPGTIYIAASGPGRLVQNEDGGYRALALPRREIGGELEHLSQCLSPFRVIEERLIRVAQPDVQGCANLFTRH